MATARIGIKCKTYYNTGNFGAPSWSELAGVGDETLTITQTEAVGTGRDSPVEETEPTIPQVEITGKIRKDSNATGYANLASSFWGRSQIDVLALDGNGASVAAEGVRYIAKNFDWTEDRAMNGVVFKNYKLKPCVGSNFTYATSVGNLSNITYSTPG